MTDFLLLTEFNEQEGVFLFILFSQYLLLQYRKVLKQK